MSPSVTAGRDELDRFFVDVEGVGRVLTISAPLSANLMVEYGDDAVLVRDLERDGHKAAGIVGYHQL